MPSAREFKLKLNAPKPRNPLVTAAHQRKAGVHRKSTKAQRRGEKSRWGQGRTDHHDD